MFRRKTPEDIPDDVYRRYVKPHFDLMNTYLVKFVVADFCAFYIFSSYNHHSEEESYDIFIDSALIFLNVDLTKNERKSLNKKVTEILKLKYGLAVTNDNPLGLQETFPELL